MSRYYYRRKMPPSAIREAVKLLNIASSKYGSDWQAVPHTHGHTELFFIISGKGQFFIQEQAFPVEAGDLVLINPNVLHTETSTPAQPLEYIVLGIDGTELATESEMDPGAAGPFRILKHFESAEIFSCLRNILRESDEKGAGFEEICQAYTEILIIRLMRSIALSPLQGASAHPQCAAVKRYIDLHFKEALTLDQLAAEVHMNKFYLSHAFRREYGIAPINYMISRRLEESKYLLAETDLSMSRIAQILGFSSLSYFSQIFRKTNGCSPLEFRQNSR